MVSVSQALIISHVVSCLGLPLKMKEVIKYIFVNGKVEPLIQLVGLVQGWVYWSCLLVACWNPVSLM